MVIVSRLDRDLDLLLYSSFYRTWKYKHGEVMKPWPQKLWSVSPVQGGKQLGLGTESYAMYAVNTGKILHLKSI